MKTLHPKRMYTLPRGGVHRGVTPFAGSEGKQAPDGSLGEASLDRGSRVKPLKEKFPFKCIF
jgi:hypothetical protein